MNPVRLDAVCDFNFRITETYAGRERRGAFSRLFSERPSHEWDAVGRAVSARPVARPPGMLALNIMGLMAYEPCTRSVLGAHSQLSLAEQSARDLLNKHNFGSSNCAGINCSNIPSVRRVAMVASGGDTHTRTWLLSHSRRNLSVRNAPHEIGSHSNYSC